MKYVFDHTKVFNVSKKNVIYFSHLYSLFNDKRKALKTFGLKTWYLKKPVSESYTTPHISPTGNYYCVFYSCHCKE